MHSLSQSVRRFLTDEAGPTAVEYAILLALILTACIGVCLTIGSNLCIGWNQATDSVGGVSSPLCD